MAHIDYYLSTTSPNVYNAGLRLEEIAARHGATITYKPIDTMVVFARTGGTPLPDRHENRKAYRLQELRRASVLAGHPINVQPMFFPTNPAPSAYAVIAAQNAGGGNLGELVYALARACWAEEKDIAEDTVIKTCLEGAGFDPGLSDSGLLSGAEIYPANTEEAIARGAFGVPTYFTDTGDEWFWGQDRLVQLDQYLAGNL